MPTDEKPTELTLLRERIDLLLEVVRGTMPMERARYLTESAATHDGLAERCLRHVRAVGEQSVAELVAATGSPASAVGRAVKRLASKGLVKMVSEPVDESGNTFRWLVYEPQNVSERKRRGSVHSDIRELGLRLPSDEDIEHWAASLG